MHAQLKRETPVFLCGTVRLQLVQSQTSECIEDLALLQAQCNPLVEVKAIGVSLMCIRSRWVCAGWNICNIVGRTLLLYFAEYIATAVAKSTSSLNRSTLLARSSPTVRTAGAATSCWLFLSLLSHLAPLSLRLARDDDGSYHSDDTALPVCDGHAIIFPKLLVTHLSNQFQTGSLSFPPVARMLCQQHSQLDNQTRYLNYPRIYTQRSLTELVWLSCRWVGVVNW